jgi:lambda family phage tail tape measure protein
VASYEAVINLVVQGEAALNRIQKKIDNLYKTVGDLETKKKFQGSQAAASFVREQANELERVVSTSKQQIKEQERSIVKQSKLNAAVDLYERRQRQLSRTSVANQKQFASQIKDIEEGFKFFKDRKSATGVQAIATELGRIIEYDNEINRISERRTTNQRRLFAFSKEIAKYESFGLKTDRARKTLSNFEQVAGSNQLKKAQQYESALRNQLRLLKDQLTEQKRVSGLAPRSPVLGGAGFPGSPRAVAAQQRAQEAALRQAQRGFPASPIGGTATMLGSPKFLAAQERARSAAERALRAQERSAKAAESAANKEADRVLKESQKGFPSSPIMGTATMAGSPRAIAAQERNRAAAERRAAAQRRAEERAAKVQQQVAVAAERAADKALKEAQKGFPSSPILGSSTVEGSPRWKAAQESARQKLESAARAAERAADRALKEAQKGFPSSPILGTATMTGSPKWKAAQERMSRMAGGGTGAGGQSGFRAALAPGEIRKEINQIVGDFNAVVPGAGNAAENITDTFAANLKKGTSQAASSAKSFATAAIDAINKAFGIASPSRFMIELVQNLVNTYIAEIQKSYPRIQAATDKAFGEQTLLSNVKELRATNRGFEFGERPSRGFRPFREAQGFGRGTEGATQEFNNMMLDFRKQIAELTTQPEIFSNLLKGLPDSRITTDLAGAANRRALASELPSFMSTQRMMGPGELEKIITSAFADYFRTIRTPNPWVGAVGDYREFIDKVIAQTKKLDTQQKLLTGARVAGALPPSSRGSRIAEAYRRSEERGRAVMAEGSFSAAQLALPPAGPRTLTDSINDLFARISSAVSSSFGGFGGGGNRSGAGGAGAGAGGGAPQGIDDLQRALGLGNLAPIARATGEQIDELTARLTELSKRIDPTTQDFAELTKQLGALGREQEKRAPGAGFLTRRLGPRGGRALSEGLVGGAFPLLFGQGIGAAAGGGLGGALGGFAGGGLGFGLSLAGTALGTAFDTAVQGAKELGAALNDTSATFDKVKERALFSSKEAEKLGDKLQELGFVASAAILSQQEVIGKIGVSGTNSLSQLSDSSDRLNRVWAELNLQLQAAIAGPMAGLLEWVADIVGIANQRGRSQAAARDLIPQDEADRKRFEQELTSAFNQTYGTGFGGNGTPRGSIEETIKFLSMDEKGRAALAELSKKFPPIELDVTIKKSQEIEEQIAVLSKRLEIVDIGKSLKDQFRSAAREQQDLDKQRADLVRSYEESIGNIRRQIEDEIRNKRFATLEKENQLLDLQGQIRLKQLQIVNQAAVAQAGVGERPEVEQAAKEIAQIVAQFTEQQLSAEEEAASVKRNAALDVQKIDSEAAQFKANIEREVSRLNIETARRVADINEQVRRKNEETDTRRFTIERDIAVLKLRLFQDELALATKDLSLPEEARTQARKLFYAVEKESLEVQKLSAPPALRGVGAVGGGSVSTAGLDRATADYRAAVENYVAAQLRLNELDVVKNAQDFAIGITEFANKTDAVLTAIQTRESDAEIERLRYIELVNAGLTDTVAQKVIELETTKRVALAVYDTAIAQLENKIVAGEVTAQVDAQNRAYLDQIKILKQRKDALEGKFGEVDTATGQGTGAIGQAIESDRGKKIQDFIAQATAELNDLEAVAVRVSQGIGDAVGNSIANGISGLVEGTTTAKEVFADFLKAMGDILIKEGTRMIAMYVAIGIAKMFAGLFGGGSETAKNFEMPGEAFIPKGGFRFPGAANGAYFADGVAAFANGGMFTNSVVSSPTLFQFADGGVTRTGLMGEAGPEAIMPLERGADGKLGVKASIPFQRSDEDQTAEEQNRLSTPFQRGQTADRSFSALSTANIPFTKTVERVMTERSERETVAAINNPKPLDVRFESQVINNTEYVTAEQHQRGMAQAAERGRALTLSALQNSVKTRKKVGMT